MSLQVWLPLNGHSNNQGLLGNLTQTTTPAYVDGKLGKSMSTGGFKMTASQTAQVLNNEAISICFWVYINAATGTTANGVMFFGTNDMGSSNNRKFSLFNYSTVNDLHYSWMNNTANTTFASGVLSGVLPSYKWTHVAVTYQNPNGTIYINGEKKHTFTGVSNSSSFAYETQVIHNSSYLKWNDYRIYNNCLSAKEVKEISKGLICHYKLSNQYETGQVNKYSGATAEGELSVNTDITRTKLTDERGYNYKLSYTGTGGNRWFWIWAGYFPFTVGKNYYYSCKVRCRSTNFALCLRAARSDNDWVTSNVGVLKPDGEWHEYVVAQTINSTYDRSGSTVTCNPRLEFCTDNLNTSGKVYSADFDIKDVQVIESDCYVSFIDNTMVSTIVSDCSGYGNNGTRSGTIAWTGTTAASRYKGGFFLNGTQYIKNNSVTWQSGKLDDITISVWIYPTQTTCGGAGGIMSDGNANIASMSMWNSVWQFADGSNWVNYSNGGITVNTWSHHVCTIKDNVIKVYKNGELVSTNTNTSIVTNRSSYNFVGVGCDFPGSDEYFYGKISDFRIYATALSADDVKALYNVSASVSKSGTLMAYEFEEV